MVSTSRGEPLADNWLTIGSGSQFPAVAPSCKFPEQNEGQRSPAAPSCVGFLALGAGGRWFESSRPDHFSRFRGSSGAPPHCALSVITVPLPIHRPLTVGSKLRRSTRFDRTHCSPIGLTHSINFPTLPAEPGRKLGLNADTKGGLGGFSSLSRRY